jgi:hypothetical protein
VTLKDYQALGNFCVVGKCEADVRGDDEDVSGEEECAAQQLVYRSSVRIMVRPETAASARPRRASSEERNGHAEAAGTDPEANGSARRDSTIGLPHRAIVKEQFR